MAKYLHLAATRCANLFCTRNSPDSLPPQLSSESPHEWCPSFRLKAIGYDAFFGEEEETSASLDWFIEATWQSIEEAGKQSEMQSVSVMLITFADFLSLHPRQDSASMLVSLALLMQHLFI